MSDTNTTTPTAFNPVSFQHEWRIRRNPIYRFMRQEFVDMFFNTGRLLLSTFEEFAKHPDELRRDSGEGKGMVIHNNPAVNEGKGLSVGVYQNSGLNAYILCGSSVCNDEMKRRYGSTGIKIRDTAAFGYLLSRYIPGFEFGWEGPCVYVDNRLIQGNAGNFEMADLKDRPGSNDISLDKLVGVAGSIAGDDLMFLKPMRYFEELEYRLAWVTSKQVDGVIDIDCPEACKLCEPIS